MSQMNHHCANSSLIPPFPSPLYLLCGKYGFFTLESSIIKKAYELTYIGGQYGVQKPTEFMCLKLLQIQPREEIVIKYITGLTESENNK